MPNALRTNSGTHLYPESTTLAITEIEATRVNLKPETYKDLSIALCTYMSHDDKQNVYERHVICNFIQCI